MQKNACISCRTSKIRCSLDTFAQHGKCRRCFNTNNDCIFKTIAPRQRRKRTDTRVAALEQRLTELQVVVDSQRLIRYDNDTELVTSSKITTAPQPIFGDANGPCASETRATTEERKWLPEVEDENLMGNGHLQSPLETLFASSLLSTDTAVRLFDDFTNNVLPQYPILALSTAENFGWLREHQPTLLLSMIVAACRASNPSLFRKLHFHLRGSLSEQVMVHGDKSVELVQAILVMVEWYDAPEDMRRLNFYTWIQIAGLMVRELGLWPWNEDTSSCVDHTITEWRVSFAAYLTMSIAAVSLRRPMSMVWTERMRRGLDAFDQNSVRDNDKRLVAWVRLQMIAEEVETLRIEVSLAPRVQTGADPASPVDQHSISSLESRFGKWRDDAQPVLNGSLRMHFFYCRIKFYELIITCSPIRSAPHTETQPPSLAITRDMAYVRTIMSLIQSSHSALDTLMLFDIGAYRRCPTTISIRALYALQEIFTVWKAIHRRQEYLSEFMSEEVLALKFYAKQTEEFFKRAAGAEGFAIPQMALKALPNIFHSLEEIKNYERRHRVQQPERLSQEDPQGAAINSPSPTANDLEVILIIDLGEIQTPSLNQDRDQGQHGTRSEVPPEWPTTAAANDDFNVTLGDAFLAPELETMIAPDSVIDPGWLFSE